MAVRPSDHQTEIGIIPRDWDVKSLGVFASFRTGPFGSTLHKSDYIEGGVPVINPMHINDGRIEPTHAMSITEGAANALADFRLKSGEVVIGRRGDMGRCAVVRPEQDGWLCGTGSMIVRGQGIDANFLQRVLSSPRAIASIEEASVGSTMVNLNQGTLARLKIQLPPLPEQTAIANALDSIDTLLSGLDRLIAKKRDLKQAAMQQLLTGQTRLPGFQGEWETRPIASVVADLEAGVSVNSVAGESYAGSGEFGILKTSCISDGSFDPTEYKLIDPRELGRAKLNPRRNSLIISRMNTPNLVGEVGFVEHDYPDLFLPDRLWMTRFRPDSGLCPRWLAYLLSSPAVKQAIKDLASGTSGSMKNIAKGKLLALPLAFPAPPEQKAIATVLSDMDAELTALEARRDKTRALKQGMMQELLTGRTRLVDAAPTAPVQAQVPTQERKANIHFLRAVLAAEIVDQLYQESTFGHVKLEKMVFLAEHLCQVDTGSTYLRKAAGPLDRKALHSIDSQLRSQKWFDARKQEGRYTYVPLAKHGGHKAYFDRHYGPIAAKLSGIIETFRALSTERCEIVATLYAAWSDLLRDKGNASDDAIVHEVLNHWHDAKQRIAEDRWRKALGWMREKGFVPQGVVLP